MIFRKLLALTTILTVVLGLSQAQESAQWTIIHYMALDNDLEGEGFGDLREMSYAGSSDDVNILVQYDRAAGHDDSQDDWTTTRRFYVENAEPQYFAVEEIAAYLAPLFNDGSASDADIAAEIVTLSEEDPAEYASLLTQAGISGEMPFSQEAIEDLDEVNMGDAQSLEEFIGFAVENYPAEHYMIVISSHGGGWHAIGPDEDNGNDMLELSEIDEALGNARDTYGIDKFDIVGFDACLMATIEVAAMLEPHADYMVAAQEVIPGEGWEYANTFNTLLERPDMDGFELGTVIVDSYMEYYAGPGNRTKVDLSVTDLSQIPDVTAALAAFAEATTTDTATILSALAVTRNNTQPFGTSAGDGGEYFSAIDLRGFMELMSAQPAIDEALFSATQAVVAAYDRAVVYARADDKLPGATGLAVYLPLNSTIYEFANQDTDYTDAIPPVMTAWDDFLRNFHAVTDEVVTGESLAIEVEQVFTVSGTASIEDQPTVLFNSDGQGVVDLAYSVLLSLDNGQQQFVDVANIAVYETLPEGQQVIEYPNGPSNTIFSWPAEIPVLTDGTNEGLVTVVTNNTADNQGLVSGTLVADEESVVANLVFDMTTRELVSIVAFQDNGEGYAAPFEVSPQIGFTFTPDITLLDEGDVATQPADFSITFSDEPVRFYYTPAPNGSYDFFLTITDLAGNTQTAQASFEVINDNVTAEWRGFTDTNRGLYFPFPYTWYDAETVVEESGIESYVLTSGDPDVSSTIYVNFTESASVDDTLTEAQARLEGAGATVSDPSDVAFEGGEGYRLDYTVSTEDGERVGVMFALYSAVSGQSYLVDLDFEADDESDLAAVAEHIQQNLRAFAPLTFEN